VAPIDPAATLSREAPRIAAADARLPRQAGVGLKPQHFTAFLGMASRPGFFEVHAENFLVDGGPLPHHLARLRETSALSLHGVGLSLGGLDPLDGGHLQSLRSLVARYQPAEFSEHLAWSSHQGRFLNDLLPVPYDNDALLRVSAHLDHLQNALGRSVLLENPATYVEFSQSTYSEEDFISEVVRRSGCGLLLDVNNAYVSGTNHGRDLHAYLSALPLAAVRQVHLAGFHRDVDSLGFPLLVDHHGSPVDEAVWELYGWVLRRLGPLPTLIEWDNDVPPLPRLLEEAGRAQSLMAGLARNRSVADGRA